ncbi:MAG TPA: 1,4-alpha-glucan branching protein GlgB [Gemmatimonadaceae bacterium]|nr:1,4-alpha-glucan branching protein GlgB [Gemmatimonadaceae bacterium]
MKADAPVVPRAAAPQDAVERLIAGRHHDPHSILGAHPVTRPQPGVVIRALHPDAKRCEAVLADGAHEMARVGGSLFEVFVPGATLPLRYRLRFYFANGSVWERDDPYRYGPTLGDVDLHLLNEGTHRRLWEKLGAHPLTLDGTPGVSFAVWAPTAQRVSVIGDFCQWDGRVFPMRSLGASGVWEIFVPDVVPGALYKYEILTREGDLRVKTDPFAFKLEQHPGTASIVEPPLDTYAWGDAEWMKRRDKVDPHREPMLAYEVHLGSWARVPEDGNRWLTYREIAPRLAQHVRDMGFTHVELLPVMEHPFYGSWGYQVSGYYAPTSRYGTPDDFRFFVDTLHRHGIGVILDWVPAHFPKDDFALRRFDGSALYEHEDPRLGEHPDWGTLIFNYGRAEVRNFLVANALFWMEEFHADGLRVDAVASMLYLDYSRQPGEWMRNRYGGRENLEAIDFLKQLNETIRHEHPGCSMIAEESTAWPGVTSPPQQGGLGFEFKWNMGWMHDTLQYFALDPIHRRWHQDQLTFAMIYEYSERFVMPLSHDEVVHGKGSLLNKMAGDEWQKLANLRALLAYMLTRPGKKLLFMGTELAPWSEWDHDGSLEWNLLRDDPRREKHCQYLARLASLYRERGELWRRDHDPDGFSWISAEDRENSVLSYVRRDGELHTVVVLNLTPVPRDNYRIGAPARMAYREVLNSDAAAWGGSGHPTRARVMAEPSPFHGFPQSIVLTLPPLSALVLSPEPGT